MTHPIPEAALGQHIAVLGKTRSGKSSVMRGLVEGLLDAEKPVCIVDPKGDWWGLKSSADGKRAGYPVVIFGGEHADVPINQHAGAHVAELVATGNRPCIIDLGGWMVGERTRFWIEFASALFKQTRGMRWLVIDEVHNFAPKGKVLDPDSGKALHWTNRLASEGLGKGLHMIFASQRPQKVHNDTLTSAETLIAMRVLHPSDRLAVSEWIKGCGDLEVGAKVLNSLAEMKRGEGWVWSPEIGFGPKRIQFAMFKTYDSFKAQPAEMAERLKGWAEVDLDEVKTKLAAVVEEAAANDPRALKRRVAELEAENTRLGNVGTPSAGIDPADYDRDIEIVRSDAFAAGVTEGRRAALEEIAPGLADAATHLAEAAQHVSDAVKTTNRRPSEPAPMALPRATLNVDRARVEAPRRRTEAGPGEEMPGPQRKLLTVLAQYPNGRTKTQLAILSGYAHNGGSYNNALANLRSRGWAEGGPDRIAITSAGSKALGSFQPLPTGSQLRTYWFGNLDGPQAKLLRVLAEAYPSGVSKEALADATGYEARGGSFNNALARLRALELATGRGGAEIRASDILFDAGERR